MSLGEALQFTLQWEGGYAHVAGDRGGETYRGISRVHHPAWIGWNYIDDVKSTEGPIKHNTIFPSLEGLVGQFYTDEYWDPLMADELPRLVAISVFDHAVHSGINRASKALQREVGAKPDGAIGRKTLAATWLHCDRLGARELIGYRTGWLERIAQRPSQAKFRLGWLRRMKALSKTVEGI